MTPRTMSRVQPPSQHPVGEIKMMVVSENRKCIPQVECSVCRWGPSSVCGTGDPTQIHVCLSQCTPT